MEAIEESSFHSSSVSYFHHFPHSPSPHPTPKPQILILPIVTKVLRLFASQCVAIVGECFFPNLVIIVFDFSAPFKTFRLLISPVSILVTQGIYESRGSAVTSTQDCPLGVRDFEFPLMQFFFILIDPFTF